MADDVFTIGRKLDSIIKNKDIHEENITDLLKALHSLPMTLEMLQKTRVGLSVNTIRKRTTNPELASLTKSLIKSWKKLVPVAKEKPKENIKNEEQREQSKSPVTQEIPVSETHSTNGSSTPEEEVKPEVTETEVDGVEELDLKDPVRNKCRDLLYNAMKKRKLDDCDIKVNMYKVATDIERCIYDEMRGVNMKYKNRIRSRVSNLGDEKNPDFIAVVLNGSVTPEMIAKMSPEEMASQKLKEKRNEYQKEAIRESQMAITTGSKTNLLTCSRCKKNEVLYNQLQTRSSDEPMTTFCVCENCGHRWKGRITTTSVAPTLACFNGAVPRAAQLHTTRTIRDETTSEGALMAAAEGMRVIPTRSQSAKEMLYLFVQDLCKQNIGEEGYKYFPFALGLFTTIGACNVLNLLPYVEMPTQIIGCTVAMSATIIGGVTIKCIQKHKLDFFSFFFPAGAPLGLAPLLVPVEMISFFSRAISLGVRLGANLTAGHMIMHIIADFGAQLTASGSVLGPVTCLALLPITVLEMAVAMIQAYVFSMLTTMYIRDTIELH